jgi:hypothetical protein
MPAPSITKLTSSVTDNTGTAPGSSFFTFTPTANKVYIIEAFLRVMSASQTNGVHLAIYDNTGGLSFSLISIIPAGGTTTTLYSFNTTGIFTATNNSFAANTNSLTTVYFHFKAPAVVSGNLDFRVKTESAGTLVTVLDGSTFRITEIA